MNRFNILILGIILLIISGSIFILLNSNQISATEEETKTNEEETKTGVILADDGAIDKVKKTGTGEIVAKLAGDLVGGFVAGAIFEKTIKGLVKKMSKTSIRQGLKSVAKANMKSLVKGLRSTTKTAIKSVGKVLLKVQKTLAKVLVRTLSKVSAKLGAKLATKLGVKTIAKGVKAGAKVAAKAGMGPVGWALLGFDVLSAALDIADVGGYGQLATTKMMIDLRNEYKKAYDENIKKMIEEEKKKDPNFSFVNISIVGPLDKLTEEASEDLGNKIIMEMLAEFYEKNGEKVINSILDNETETEKYLTSFMEEIGTSKIEDFVKDKTEEEKDKLTQEDLMNYIEPFFMEHISDIVDEKITEDFGLELEKPEKEKEIMSKLCSESKGRLIDKGIFEGKCTFTNKKECDNSYNWKNLDICHAKSLAEKEGKKEEELKKRKYEIMDKAGPFTLFKDVYKIKNDEYKNVCVSDGWSGNIKRMCEIQGDKQDDFIFNEEHKVCVPTKTYCMKKGADYKEKGKHLDLPDCVIPGGQKALEFIFGETITRGLKQVFDMNQYKPCNPGDEDNGFFCARNNCDKNTEEYKAGFCYEKCKPGYKSVALECEGSCPPGSKNTGLTCLQPTDSYSRAFTEGDPKPMTCPSDKEQKGALCYPKCNKGYESKALECEGSCPPGTSNTGLTCMQKTDSYTRAGQTHILVCKSNEEQNGALCYPKCKPGYSGVGPVCWGKCNSDEVDVGALCRKKCKAGYHDVAGVCWRNAKSYGRGVGAVPTINCPGGYDRMGVGDAGWCHRWWPPHTRGYNSTSCPGNKPDKTAGLCYPRCKSGYHGAGPMCHPNGSLSYVPPTRAKSSHGRGAGTPLSQCPSSHPDKVLALCYKKCNTGFIPASDERKSDSALTCVKPCMKNVKHGDETINFKRTSAALGSAFCDNSRPRYSRALKASPLTDCPSTHPDKVGLLCYKKCKSDFIPASNERKSDSALTCVKPCMKNAKVPGLDHTFNFNRTSAALGTSFCDTGRPRYTRIGAIKGAGYGGSYVKERKIDYSQKKTPGNQDC